MFTLSLFLVIFRLYAYSYRVVPSPLSFSSSNNQIIRSTTPFHTKFNFNQPQLSYLPYSNYQPYSKQYSHTKHYISLQDFQEKYFKLILLRVKKLLISSSLFASTVIPRPLTSFPKSTHSSGMTIARDSSYKYKPKVNYHDIPVIEDHEQVTDTTEMTSTQKDVIRRYGTSFVREAVKSVGPSVVRIDCEREIQSITSMFSPSDGFREVDTVKISGSGIVVAEDGYLVTNAHVVQDAKKITITLSNGRTFKVKLIAFDELTDLAVLKAEVVDDVSLVPAPLGDSSVLQSGDWVIAVGCPVGLDFTVTLGIVSNPKRSSVEVGVPYLKGNYIQTDAALNSGNSGGPLVNDLGQVIGINTMVRTNTEAIGFAIPINRVKDIYHTLKQGKKPNHAYFGIEVMSLTPDYAKIHNDDPNAARLPEIHGALILRVLPNSPAALAGIRKYDVITEVNGHPIANSGDAETNLDHCKPGATARMKIARGENSALIDIQANPQDLLAVMEERKKRPQISQ